MTSAATPAVSVFITTRNRLALLKKALDGVYAQTFRDFEVVVVDNDSSDGTEAWLSRKRLPRLRLVRLPLVEGPASARSRGLRELRGRLVAFLDSDDLWNPDYLEMLVPLFADPKIVVAFSDFQHVDGAGRLLPQWPGLRFVNPLFKSLCGLEYLPLISATVIRRSALRRVGFDRGFRAHFEDVDFYFRLAQRYGRGSFHFVNSSLAYYRRHDDQLTAGSERGRLFSMGNLERWDRLTEDHRQGMLDFAYLGCKNARLFQRDSISEPLA